MVCWLIYNSKSLPNFQIITAILQYYLTLNYLYIFYLDYSVFMRAELSAQHYRLGPSYRDVFGYEPEGVSILVPNKVSSHNI